MRSRDERSEFRAVSHGRMAFANDDAHRDAPGKTPRRRKSGKPSRARADGEGASRTAAATTRGATGASASRRTRASTSIARRWTLERASHVVVVVAVVSGSVQRRLTRSAQRASVALVIPFTRREVESSLNRSLSFWREYPPCVSTRKTRRLGDVHVAFHYNLDLHAEEGKRVEAAVRRAWVTALPPSVRACFTRRSPTFMSANLSSEDDAYPVGPCAQHWRTFDALQRDDSPFDHWFQFELDVTPVREDWGTRMLALARANGPNCSEWWQLGSLPLGDDITGAFIVRGRAVPDQHLNGNSMYCLRSHEYDAYRRQVRERFPPMGCFAKTDRGREGGFDTASYLHRADPNRYHVSRFHAHRFRASDFVLNYGEGVSAGFFANARFAETSFLVHSKLRLSERFRGRGNASASSTTTTTRGGRSVWTCDAGGCSWVIVDDEDWRRGGGREDAGEMIAIDASDDSSSSPSSTSSFALLSNTVPPWLEFARNAASRDGVVFVMLFNEAYVEMVKSFMCNLDALGARHPLVLIATEPLAAGALNAFPPLRARASARVFIHEHATSGALDYGTREYFELTLTRLIIQERMMRYGVNHMIIEADATWFAPDIATLVTERLKHFEIVSANDGDRSSGDAVISAGFSAYRATPRARRFFKRYVETYTKLLQGANDVNSTARWKSFIGEQHVLTRMLAERDAPRVFWLDACAFSANGKWYEDATYRARCDAPKVVQNNYIVGNAAKMSRAKIWGHWFVDESGARCLDDRRGSTQLSMTSLDVREDASRGSHGTWSPVRASATTRGRRSKDVFWLEQDFTRDKILRTTLRHRRNRFLILIPGHGGNVRRRQVLEENVRHLRRIKGTFDCVLFTYGGVDAAALRRVAQPCRVVHESGWTWSAFLRSVTPSFIDEVGYTEIIVALDDVDFASPHFDMGTFVREMRTHRLDVASPNVRGSRWKKMRIAMTSRHDTATDALTYSEGGGYLTQFAEIQLTAFTPASWRCLHKMINPELNPWGWWFDVCFSSACDAPRIGVLDVLVTRVGAGDVVPNGTDTTHAHFPTRADQVRYATWLQETFPDANLSRGVETCMDTSVRSATVPLEIPPLSRQDYEQRDDNILRVLYINRARRGDRNRTVFAELMKANLTHVTRIEAEEVFADARVLESCWDPAMRRKCAGQIGCQRSHVKAIGHAMSRGWSFVAIFEDDFRWLPHFDPVQFTSIIERVRASLTEWDVIGVSHNIIERENVYVRTGDARVLSIIPSSSSERVEVIRVTRALGAHAYIVRARAYAALIRAFESCDVRRDVETAIDTCWYPLQRELNWYGFAPQLGTQADGFSDIEQRHVSYGIS